jgi:hypothetical protein
MDQALDRRSLDRLVSICPSRSTTTVTVARRLHNNSHFVMLSKIGAARERRMFGADCIDCLTENSTKTSLSVYSVIRASQFS